MESNHREPIEDETARVANDSEVAELDVLVAQATANCR
jgi:hypothetical protein